MATYYYGYTSTAATWNGWCSSGTSSTSTGDTWTNWNCYYTTTVSAIETATSNVWVTWTNYPVQSKEEIERERIASEERQRKHQEEIRKQEEERKLAEIKAHELLEDLIGKEQAEIYKETGRLLVKGQTSDYLLQKGGKVSKIEKNKVTDFCIHLRDKSTMPDTDNIVSLMLLAKADEYEFDKTANVIRSYKKNELPELRSACA